jgi:hypothetical protein
LEFLGVDAEAFKKEAATGKGDGDLLKWIQANQKKRPAEAQIREWSEQQDRRRPDAESREFFDRSLHEIGTNRTDIETWADLIDLDDFVSFGGKA